MGDDIVSNKWRMHSALNALVVLILAPALHGIQGELVLHWQLRWSLRRIAMRSYIRSFRS